MSSKSAKKASKVVAPKVVAPRFKSAQLKTCQKLISFGTYENVYEGSSTQNENALNKKAILKFVGNGDDDQGYIGNFLGGVGRFAYIKHLDPNTNREVFRTEFKGA